MPTFVGVGGSVYLGIVYMGHREKAVVGLLHLVEGTVCKESSSPLETACQHPVSWKTSQEDRVLRQGLKLGAHIQLCLNTFLCSIGTF